MRRISRHYYDAAYRLRLPAPLPLIPQDEMVARIDWWRSVGFATVPGLPACPLLRLVAS